jgi:hypothetical protein
MRFKSVYILIPLLALVALALLGSQSGVSASHFDERVKVALRASGHELLLANNDSTSLVKPVLRTSDLKYELSFGTDLRMAPGQLVSIVNEHLKAAQLPSDYIVEVIDCSTHEVAYSYLNTAVSTKQIVACAERELPLYCYTITVLFTKPATELIAYNHYPLYSLVLVGFIGVGVVYQSKNKKTATPITDTNQSHIPLGAFKFYMEQQQLVHENKVIALTLKECELLYLFSTQQNTLIKRDYLIKTVWEDQGVFVGRSLDTYISKLRKKLALDARITLINVHGVGYKLEVLDA